MTHPLLAQALATGAPLIDDTRATFVWQGPKPPLLVGDLNGWDAARAPTWLQVAPDLWTCQIGLPRDAYIEYAYFAAGDRGERLPDPLNPRTTPNGMGAVNSFFYMPDAGPTPLIARRADAPAGRLSHHTLESSWLLANGRRSVWLYRPPVGGPAPLIVVFDGWDYLQRGQLADIADNLIAQGRIAPIALAFADHGGPARGVEYLCSEATLRFVVDLVVPLAQAELDLVDLRQAPGAFGVLGASAGGRMALFTGLMQPQIFGHVLSQSGAFGAGERESVVFSLVRYGPPRPLKVWLDCGRYESLLDANRQMYAALTERGYAATYHEFNAGHNVPAWRDRVAHGLEQLFGPHTMRAALPKGATIAHFS